MAFQKYQFVSGYGANASQVNSNFIEIYSELENFPDLNGALKTDIIAAGCIKDGAVNFSHLHNGVYATSAEVTDTGALSDTKVCTSAAVQKLIDDYVAGIMPSW